MKKVLKPKVGLKILNPKTKRYLNEDGEQVTIDTYWQRMLNSGDVVEHIEEKKVMKKTVKNKGNENDNTK